MADRDLAEQVKSLNKAISENAASSVIVTMLDKLKSQAAPSEQALRATKAGVVVGKLRTHKDKSIASASSSIVRKWKESVEASKNKKMSSTSAVASPGPGSGTASPAPSSSTGATTTNGSTRPDTTTQPFRGDPEKRTWETDGVKTDVTSVKPRNGSIGLMYNGLAFRCDKPMQEILERALEVEAAAHKTYTGGSALYSQKISSLYQNLKSKSNRQLSHRVMSGKIGAFEFVNMTQEEMKSEAQKTLEQKLEKENMREAQVAMPEKSVSDALTCGKCHNKKVSYTQAQTRSADEPMTTFCECLVCGNRWKFS